MRLLAAILLAFALLACGGSAPAPDAEPKAAAKPAPKPPDESRRFPLEGRQKVELVDNRLLGKDYLPGGNLAAYEKDGKQYQLFLIVTKDPDAAAFLEDDIKNKLTNPKRIAHFGGHFGMDGDTPWFVFPKQHYVGGVIGLPLEEADQVARDFAARVF